MSVLVTVLAPLSAEAKYECDTLAEGLAQLVEVFDALPTGMAIIEIGDVA